MIGSILFTSEERIRVVMYMPCVKCSCSELRFDIKMKKSRSGFDSGTVLISKQIFFQHRVWPV